MRHIFRLGLALAGAGMVGSLAAVPAQAGETKPAGFKGWYRLEPISLTCWDTEDTIGSDEAYLTFQGLRVWGVQSMSEGDSVWLENDPRLTDLRFESTAFLRLYDADTGIFDKDDWLGSLGVDVDMSNGQERTAYFDWDGASYELTYRVRHVPPA